MQTVTIIRSLKGTWMKRFDDYEKSFTKISKEEALESIQNARKKGAMLSDDDENKDTFLMFGYKN